MERSWVRRVSACRLTTGDGEWVYAREHREQVLAEFERQRASNSGYFNGPIQIMLSHRIEHDTLIGEFAKSDFASFVYWRTQGLVDDSVRDCFGTAIVRSTEGHILLGVQSAGNLNAGRAYFPSGFIDQADVRADGTIDIDGSVVREIEEETGLDVGTLKRTPGYILAAAAASIAVAVEYRSSLPSCELRAAVLANLARQADPELADIVMVGKLAELDGRPTTPHVQPLLAALL